MKNVLCLLERAAQLYPGKVAVGDEESTITYKELRNISRWLGQFLRENVLDVNNSFIGVKTDRSIYTVIMFFGVLYSGGAYVPLNQEKNEFNREIIHDSGVKTIIDKSNVLNIIELTDNNPELKKQWDALCDENWNQLLNDRSDRNMYAVYTSGSTGKPKGIVKTHGAMLSFLEAFQNKYPMDEEYVIGNQTKMYFDASAKDIFWAVKNCCRLEIIPDKCFLFPAKLVEYMNEKKVSFICWVPGIYTYIAGLDGFKDMEFKYLRFVGFVGEKMPVKTLKYWMKYLKDVRFVNMYGMSETAGVVLSYEVTENDAFDELPVGKPFDNTSIRIENGRLLISSDSLYKEYLGCYKTVSAQSMILFSDNGTEVKYYDTGDLAYMDYNGNVVVTGRSDFQIKHLGYRIELEQIEAAAYKIKEINKCGCVYDVKKDRIVLFCEVNTEVYPYLKEKNEREIVVYIKNELKKSLPEYCLPGKIIIGRVPVNDNGKVDRPKLMLQL